MHPHPLGHPQAGSHTPPKPRCTRFVGQVLGDALLQIHLHFDTPPPVQRRRKRRHAYFDAILVTHAQLRRDMRTGKIVGSIVFTPNHHPSTSHNHSMSNGKDCERTRTKHRASTLPLSGDNAHQNAMIVAP